MTSPTAGRTLQVELTMEVFKTRSTQKILKVTDTNDNTNQVFKQETKDVVRELKKYQQYFQRRNETKERHTNIIITNFNTGDKVNKGLQNDPPKYIHSQGPLTAILRSCTSQCLGMNCKNHNQEMLRWVRRRLARGHILFLDPTGGLPRTWLKTCLLSPTGVEKNDDELETEARMYAVQRYDTRF